MVVYALLFALFLFGRCIRLLKIEMINTEVLKNNQNITSIYSQNVVGLLGSLCYMRPSDMMNI